MVLNFNNLQVALNTICKNQKSIGTICFDEINRMNIKLSTKFFKNMKNSKF